MGILKQFYYGLFFGKRFYRMMAVIIFLFIISYGIPFLFIVAQFGLVIFILAVIVDFTILFHKKEPVSVQRILPEKLSNGDENNMIWNLLNLYPYKIRVSLIDEFPESWQIRDCKLKTALEPFEKTELSYKIRPKKRGEYFFGNLNLYIQTPLQLILRRKTFSAEAGVKVIPSFLLLRQLEFMAHITDPGNTGYKQVRKTGHSLEFEQIREYVSGDDIRSINWKATGRTGGQLMMNNYTDEKSQQVYCIIDKGRTMKMAFDGLSLLDYAVNATLAMCSVAISKQDRAGLISFGDRTGDFLPATHRAIQLSGIVNALYNLDTLFLESDYAFLHKLVKTRINQRSLLILFTNFESLTALGRQLPYLRNIAQKHLLLVVFFENTSLQTLATEEVGSMERLYEKVIAEKFVMEKKLIVKELQRFGIAALLTAPEKLSVDIVNRYLQIKARREI